MCQFSQVGAPAARRAELNPPTPDLQRKGYSKLVLVSTPHCHACSSPNTKINVVKHHPLPHKKIHLNTWEAEESEFVASLVYILSPCFQK